LKNGLINPIKKHKRHTPLESPLNGGINSTILLLGGVPLAAGRVPLSVSQMASIEII
jgi:hypothetical protein